MTPQDLLLPFDGGYLRPLGVQDVHDGYINGLNDPAVNRYLDGVKHARQTRDSVVDFVNQNAAAPNAVFFGVWLDGKQQHCGTVRIYGIEHHHHTAHIGICLFDSAVWGKGIARKAIRSASAWAAQTFDLRWIEAGAYEPNIASQRSFLSAGYEWVSDMPGKYLFENQPTTVKIYAYRAK